MGTIVSSLLVIAVGAIGLALGVYFKLRDPYRGTYVR